MIRGGRLRLLALAGTAAAALAVRSPAPQPRAEILWDTWGVPHVYGQDAQAVLYGFGWAQAQAHGDLLLELYGQSRGRAAEYWGPERADGDRLVRMLGIPRRGDAWYAAQTVEERALLDAFVQGINDYAREHPEAIDDRMELVLPVRGADVLSHVQHAIHFTFLSSPAREIHRLAAGSNAWAIAPARSASGRAMLLANPHLPWGGLFTFFEAHLVAPGLDAYGTSLVGFPFLGIAFNDRLGWTHTVNPIDGSDLYELTLAEDGYAWDGGVRPFEARVDTIRIRAEDGSLRAEPLLVLESVHGPVIAREGEKLYALRVAGLDQPHLLGQYWEMARARDLAQFEAALKRHQMPMFNTIYADHDGHVLYVFNGRVPVRPPSDWDAWAGTVRGDTSATLWTSVHAYEHLPRVLDPPSGWIQNANDPPWTATLPPLDPDDYPPYMAPRSTKPGLWAPFRPQRSMRMLAEDERISFDEMILYKHSTRMELADRILDELVPAAREKGGLAARAAEILAAWDRSTEAESRGAVLFVEFHRELTGDPGPSGRFFAVPWSLERPLETPDRLADPARAVTALEEAAARVEAEHGALDVGWGEVHRFRRDTLDLPGNGAEDPLGVFRAAGYDEDPDGRFRASRGDTYIAVIEFGDPLRAMGLLGYGNWSRPGSPHRTDQLPLLAEKRLRPIWRVRSEVEAHLERQETLP